MPIPNPKVKPQLFPDQGKATQSQKENWEERKNKTVGILCMSLELSYKTGHSTNLHQASTVCSEWCSEQRCKIVSRWLYTLQPLSRWAAEITEV